MILVDTVHGSPVTTDINIVPPTPTTDTATCTQLTDLNNSNKFVDAVKYANEYILSINNYMHFRSSGQSTPHFSPVVSLRNSPEPSFQDWEIKLEDNIRKWAAQIIVALEYLHANGIICRYLLILLMANHLSSLIGICILAMFC